MPSPPLPDSSGAQHCSTCGQLVDPSRKFCPHCGARLQLARSEGANSLKIVLLLLGAILFGGLGACMMVASGVAGGTGSALQDFLAGTPGFLIALFFLYRLFKEVTNRTHH